MKIIRWLLSHTFLILLIVAVIYGYMFWGNLLGEDTPAGKAVAYLSNEFVVVDEFVEAVKAKQAQLSEKDTVQAQAEDQAGVQENTHGNVNETAVNIGDDVRETRPVAAEPAVTTPVVAQEAVAQEAAAQPAANESETVTSETASGRNIDQQPVNISYSHNNMQVNQNSSGVISTSAVSAEPVDSTQVQKQQVPRPDSRVENKAASVQAPPAPQNDSFVSAEVEKRLDNVDEHGHVIDPMKPGGEVRANWITARKSFYQRKYALSEKSYQQVIDNTTDNFDAYGELGNVYFDQGKKQQAASAYLKAASILIRKGQVRRARSLTGLLHIIDESKAKELQKMLQSSSSS